MKPGIKAWSAQLEVSQLDGVIGDRMKQLENADPQQAQRLESEVKYLQQQLKQHRRTFERMDESTGVGYVAAKGKRGIKRSREQDNNEQAAKKPKEDDTSSTATEGLTETNIERIVSARGDRPYKDIRKASESLRNQEAARNSLENIQQQRNEGAGTKDNPPIVIPNIEGHFAAQADVASARRKPWQRENFAFGQHQPDDIVATEQQTYSTFPGSIFVKEGGKYNDLMSELEVMKKETGLTPIDFLQGIEKLVQEGRVPPAFAKNPQYEKKLKAMTRLMMNVEPGRSLPATVTIPINFMLMKKGKMTPQEAFVDLNLMSPQKITKIAHRADEYLGFEREGQYKQKATDKQVKDFLEKEKKWLVRYLLSKTEGKKPSINNEKELELILDNLPDVLISEVKKFMSPRSNNKTDNK